MKEMEAMKSLFVHFHHRHHRHRVVVVEEEAEVEVEDGDEEAMMVLLLQLKCSASLFISRHLDVTEGYGCRVESHKFMKYIHGCPFQSP
jgi:hypothetical protein